MMMQKRKNLFENYKRIMDPIVKTGKLNVVSPAFVANDFIPAKYTCQGKNVNPAISIENIPSGTKSLALIVEDQDAHNGVFVHWLIWNIHPTEMILENSAHGVEGKNGFGKIKYQGPCPPEGETHRYSFKIYALDKTLGIPEGTVKEDLEKAMNDHILAQGEFIGLYKNTKD